MKRLLIARFVPLSELQRRLSAFALLLGAALVVGPGCASTRIETGIHPNNNRYEELPVRMGRLKSVQTRAGQDPRLAVAVAISGGGERASNFGVGVLLGLEELRLPGGGNRNALSEVDYLSTVSGGGFAAGAYIGSLHDWIRTGGEPADYSFRLVIGSVDSTGSKCDERPPYIAGHRFDPCARRHLEQGYEKAIAGFLNPFDPVSWRVWFTTLDRTNLLERAIDDRLLGALWRCQETEGGCEHMEQHSIRLKDLFVPEGSAAPVRMPYWVANATTFEDGNIFPFTPEHLIIHRVRSYVHRLELEEFEPEDMQRSDYERWVFNIPVALGVTASGNFPVALPATTLKSGFDSANPYLHLLDGGLADNLGVYTAIRLLQQDSRGQAKRRVLIVVDAYKDVLGPFSLREGAPLATESYERTTSSGLDSWRARYREIASALAKAAGIEHVVFISFDDLNESGELARLKALDHGGLEAPRLLDTDIAKLVEDLREREASEGLAELADEWPLTLPFKLLRNVATSYNVSVEEQKLLVAAGRRIVQKKGQQISAALTMGAGR